MLSLKINSLKEMTKLLFTDETFDKFMLHDAEFVTQFTTTIQGKKNQQFFEEEKQEEEMKSPYTLYRDMRPLFFSLIKGKRLPLSFKLVLLTSKEATDAMVRKTDFTSCEVTSMSLNFTFKSNELNLTTGISYGGFSMDKTLEKYWDEYIIKFLQQKDIEFEEL